MNAKIMIAIIATFAMLFAGVAVASEAADAEGTYSLTYYVGDKSKVVEQDEAAFTVSDVTSLSLVVPEGKEFAGWYTEADGQGTPYTAGSTFTIQGEGVTSAKLVAKLTDKAPETVIVKFNVNDTIYTKTLTITNGQITLPTMSDLGASVPAGMEFKGWKTGETTYAAGSVIAEPAEGTTYDAVMTPVTYSVTFVADGQTVSTVSGTSEDAVVAPTAPSKTGFTFKGWSSDDGATLITDFTDVKFTANITYDAIYVEDYALTFEVDGTAYPGGTVADPIIPQTPVKDGFSFKGWSTDGNNVIEDIESAIASVNEATKFVAIFEPAVYTVSFEVDGQIVATQTVKHGELATEPAFIPALDGMDFVEWDYDFAQAITGDTTIVAVFEPTPEPELTGLDNPAVQIMAIIIGVLAIFLVAMLVWKKDEVMTIVVKKLDKSKKPEEPKQ